MDNPKPRSATVYPLPVDLEKQAGEMISVAVHGAQLVFQDARVFKSGNSLAFRIPSVVAKQLKLEEGTPIEMAFDDGKLFIQRKSTTPTLDKLLARITPENLHREEFSELLDSERW